MTTDALATTSKESTAAAIYQSPAAILRPTTARYPELGRIRAGIKIIKRQWNQATGKADLPPDAKDIKVYQEMMDKGASWDDIERAINPRYFTEQNMKDHKVKRKLIPVNIPYFFVRPSDCKVPEDASKLVDLYGDKEDHNRIKAFPVVFYSNLWWENIDSSYVCYSAEAVRFRSQIIVASSDNGLIGKRMCMVPPPPIPGVRPSGVDREWSPRPNTPEYRQDGECRPRKMPSVSGKGMQSVCDHPLLYTRNFRAWLVVDHDSFLVWGYRDCKGHVRYRCHHARPPCVAPSQWQACLRIEEGAA